MVSLCSNCLNILSLRPKQNSVDQDQRLQIVNFLCFNEKILGKIINCWSNLDSCLEIEFVVGFQADKTKLRKCSTCILIKAVKINSGTEHVIHVVTFKFYILT